MNEPTTADMAAFGASDRACYDYPEDTDIAKAQRAAFCAGAGWAATEIERLQAALTQVRGFAAIMTANNWLDCKDYIARQCNVLSDEQKADGNAEHS